jgi:hypothetical protein
MRSNRQIWHLWGHLCPSIKLQADTRSRQLLKLVRAKLGKHLHKRAPHLTRPHVLQFTEPPAGCHAVNELWVDPINGLYDEGAFLPPKAIIAVGFPVQPTTHLRGLAAFALLGSLLRNCIFFLFFFFFFSLCMQKMCKELSVKTDSPSFIVVVLSRSMEPAFQ